MKTETCEAADQKDIDALLDRLHTQAYEHECKLVEYSARYFLLGLSIGALLIFVISWL